MWTLRLSPSLASYTRHLHARPSLLGLLKPHQLAFPNQLLDAQMYLVEAGGDVDERDVGHCIVCELLVLHQASALVLDTGMPMSFIMALLPLTFIVSKVKSDPRSLTTCDSCLSNLASPSISCTLMDD